MFSGWWYRSCCMKVVPIGGYPKRGKLKPGMLLILGCLTCFCSRRPYVVLEDMMSTPNTNNTIFLFTWTKNNGGVIMIIINQTKQLKADQSIHNKPVNKGFKSGTKGFRNRKGRKGPSSPASLNTNIVIGPGSRPPPLAMMPRILLGAALDPCHYSHSS